MSNETDRQIARKSILFSNMPEDLANTLFDRAAVQEYQRGATIFLEGDPAAHVHVVLEGWVKLFRITQGGAEAVVGVFTKGSSFAEAAAFRTDSYPVSAQAVTDCRLMHVRASQVLDAMKSRPEVCIAMLASTFQHLRGLVAQVEQLKARTGTQRLAKFLLELCPVEEGACAVTLPYDKVLIAGRLGMQPESLSRAFGRLRQVGVTVRQNRALVEDVDRLRDAAEEDRPSAWRKAR